MKDFLHYLYCAFFGGCSHRGGLAYGWPTRRVDGQDWQKCNKCGHERVSPIQFGRQETPSDGEPA